MKAYKHIVVITGLCLVCLGVAQPQEDKGRRVPSIKHYSVVDICYEGFMADSVKGVIIEANKIEYTDPVVHISAMQLLTNVLRAQPNTLDWAKQNQLKDIDVSNTEWSHLQLRAALLLRIGFDVPIPEVEQLEVATVVSPQQVESIVQAYIHGYQAGVASIGAEIRTRSGLELTKQEYNRRFQEINRDDPKHLLQLLSLYSELFQQWPPVGSAYKDIESITGLRADVSDEDFGKVHTVSCKDEWTGGGIHFVVNEDGNVKHVNYYVISE